jgi:hypothetical protein
MPLLNIGQENIINNQIPGLIEANIRFKPLIFRVFIYAESPQSLYKQSRTGFFTCP